MTMRITIRLPDDIGEEVKRRTDNVSAHFKEARRRLLRFAGTGVDPNLHEINQRERREGDRTVSG